MSQIQQKLKKLLADADLSELIKGGGSSFILRVLSMVLGFIFNWMIVKYYDTASLGLLISAMSVLTLVTILSRFGLDTSFLRFVSEYRSKNQFGIIKIIEKKSLFVIIPLSIFLTATLYFGADFFAENFFNKPQLGASLKYISLCILPTSLYFFYSEGLRGLKKIPQYTFIQNPLRFLLGIGLIFFFVFILNNKISVELIFSIAVFATMFWCIYYWQNFFPKSEIQNTQVKNQVSYKDIFNLSIPLLLASSTAFMVNWTDTIVLTIYRPDEEIAIYNTALKFSTLAKLNLMAINSISAPKFAELFSRKDFTTLQKVTKQSAKLGFWTSLPATIFLLIFPSFVLGIYGDDFKAGVLSLVILIVAQLLAVIAGPVGHFLQMTNNQKIYQNIILGTTLLSVVLNFSLIPIWGIEGAAVSAFFTIIIQNYLCAYYIKKQFGFWPIYIPFSKYK